MIRRGIWPDSERTAGRIAAEESALRTTQDLQALKVIEVGEALRRPSDVNAIDIGSHGRIIGEDRLKITLSANSNIGKRRRARRAGGDDYARRCPLHIGDIAPLRADQRGLTQRSHGSWRRLQAFFLPARRRQTVLAAR